MNCVRREVEPGKYLIEYDSVSSTQRIARDLFKAGDSAIIGVRAGYQEAGRGRLGADWYAPPGTCLLVTYIVPFRDPRSAHMLGMTSALGTADSLKVCGLVANLKWPNDVLIHGRKVAGILVETVNRPSGDSAALIGIGVNLNVIRFPPELEHRATSVRIEGSCETDLVAFEEILRRHVFARCAQLNGDGFGIIVESWLLRDVSLGMKYQLTEGDSVSQGTCVGISESGAISLRLETGELHQALNATSFLVDEDK